jgi:hypothetical protein
MKKYPNEANRNPLLSNDLFTRQSPNPALPTEWIFSGSKTIMASPFECFRDYSFCPKNYKPRIFADLSAQIRENLRFINKKQARLKTKL